MVGNFELETFWNKQIPEKQAFITLVKYLKNTTVSSDQKTKITNCLKKNFLEINLDNLIGFYRERYQLGYYDTSFPTKNNDAISDEEVNDAIAALEENLIAPVVITETVLQKARKLNTPTNQLGEEIKLLSSLNEEILSDEEQKILSRTGFDPKVDGPSKQFKKERKKYNEALFQKALNQFCDSPYVTWVKSWSFIPFFHNPDEDLYQLLRRITDRAGFARVHQIREEANSPEANSPEAFLDKAMEYFNEDVKAYQELLEDEATLEQLKEEEYWNQDSFDEIKSQKEKLVASLEDWKRKINRVAQNYEMDFYIKKFSRGKEDFYFQIIPGKAIVSEKKYQTRKTKKRLQMFNSLLAPIIGMFEGVTVTVAGLLTFTGVVTVAGVIAFAAAPTLPVIIFSILIGGCSFLTNSALFKGDMYKVLKQLRFGGVSSLFKDMKAFKATIMATMIALALLTAIFVGFFNYTAVMVFAAAFLPAVALVNPIFGIFVLITCLVVAAAFFANFMISSSKLVNAIPFDFNFTPSSIKECFKKMKEKISKLDLLKMIKGPNWQHFKWYEKVGRIFKIVLKIVFAAVFLALATLVTLFSVIACKLDYVPTIMAASQSFSLNATNFVANTGVKLFGDIVSWISFGMNFLMNNRAFVGLREKIESALNHLWNNGYNKPTKNETSSVNKNSMLVDNKELFYRASINQVSEIHMKGLNKNDAEELMKFVNQNLRVTALRFEDMSQDAIHSVLDSAANRIKTVAFQGLTEEMTVPEKITTLVCSDTSFMRITKLPETLHLMNLTINHIEEKDPMVNAKGVKNLIIDGKCDQDLIKKIVKAGSVQCIEFRNVTPDYILCCLNQEFVRSTGNPIDIICSDLKKSSVTMDEVVNYGLYSTDFQFHKKTPRNPYETVIPIVKKIGDFFFAIATVFNAAGNAFIRIDGGAQSLYDIGGAQVPHNSQGVPQFDTAAQFTSFVGSFSVSFALNILSVLEEELIKAKTKIEKVRSQVKSLWNKDEKHVSLAQNNLFNHKNTVSSKLGMPEIVLNHSS